LEKKTQLIEDRCTLYDSSLGHGGFVVYNSSSNVDDESSCALPSDAKNLGENEE
jgi:hypothetical protein